MTQGRPAGLHGRAGSITMRLTASGAKHGAHPADNCGVSSSSYAGQATICAGLQLYWPLRYCWHVVWLSSLGATFIGWQPLPNPFSHGGVLYNASRMCMIACRPQHVSWHFAANVAVLPAADEQMGTAAGHEGNAEPATACQSCCTKAQLSIGAAGSATHAHQLLVWINDRCHLSLMLNVLSSKEALISVQVPPT